MKQLVVTAEARSDLKEIDRYSRQTWGIERTRIYVGTIVETFADLMTNNRRGRPVDEFGVGMRRTNVRQHAIYYFLRGERVVVARVLHQRMNVTLAMFKPDEM
ncbi:MAG TPA: type II toxin-antitoxin system RelE/ParE family toxin [Caulobacteraceae bacterium]|jgi:toxin ParE1/3/4